MLVLNSCKSDEPEPPEPKEGTRTVMVYMVANNNLGSSDFDKDDLEEMLAGVRAGALGEGGRLLVFHEAYEETAVLKEVTPEGIAELKTYSPESSGIESSTMRLALDDMERLAPAESYGLILWSHATGWIEDGIAERRSTTASCESTPLSFGLSRRNKMNITTLADVLEEYDFDFVYFDCCYMMGVETVYELRHCAPVLAGSPTELPSAGMPYDRTLPYFFRSGTPDITGAARTTFEHYDGLSGTARTSTMSVVRTDALEELASATRAIFEVSKAGMPAEPFAPQKYSAVSVSKCNYFDFGQYMRHLGSGHPTLLNNFETALRSAVVYEDATPFLWSAVALTDHSGLSTYILPSYADATDRGYSTLQWWSDVASHLQQ